MWRCARRPVACAAGGAGSACVSFESARLTPPAPPPRAPQCPTVGTAIKACQARGKKVVLSLGGAAGLYGFASDAEAAAFANTLWQVRGARMRGSAARCSLHSARTHANRAPTHALSPPHKRTRLTPHPPPHPPPPQMFLGGSAPGWPRPFGDAVLDGIDLDIEGARVARGGLRRKREGIPSAVVRSGTASRGMRAAAVPPRPAPTPRVPAPPFLTPPASRPARAQAAAPLGMPPSSPPCAPSTPRPPPTPAGAPTSSPARRSAPSRTHTWATPSPRPGLTMFTSSFITTTVQPPRAPSTLPRGRSGRRRPASTRMLR